MNIDRAREMLEDSIWSHPKDYGGFSPDGHYCITTQHRDSDALDRSNYVRIFEDLESESAKHDKPENQCDHDSVNDYAECKPWAYDWRAGHWAVGWVEYIMVRHDAPDSLIILAAEIVCALADYPVYDETHYSELEWNEAADYWAPMSISERMYYCKEADISVFAARQDYIPQDDNGYIYESLRSA